MKTGFHLNIYVLVLGARGSLDQNSKFKSPQSVRHSRMALLFLLRRCLLIRKDQDIDAPVLLAAGRFVIACHRIKLPEVP